MKRALFFAGILCAATVCFAQGDRGLWGESYAEKEEFEIKNSGVINIDGIQTGFHMTVHDKAWKQSGQTDRLMIPWHSPRPARSSNRSIRCSCSTRFHFRRTGA